MMIVISDAASSVWRSVLAPYVERAGRLVENQHIGLFDECSGDDQPLLLTAAEVAALLADLAVVPIRERATSS